MKRSSDGTPVAVADPLVLPHAHALSLGLARESASLLSPGLVELALHAGSEQGHGALPWPLRVGGAGLGDAAALAAVIGAPPRAPLAARFAVPVAGLPVAGCMAPASTTPASSMRASGPPRPPRARACAPSPSARRRGCAASTRPTTRTTRPTPTRPRRRTRCASCA